jgi:O-antigen ligase
MFLASKIKSFFDTKKHYLFLIYFLLLPFGGVYLIYSSFILLLAVLSLNDLNKNILNNCYFYLFFLIWTPMVLSLFDAINIDRSFIKTISVLPFLFIGLYISSNITIKKIYNLMLLLVVASVVWAIDFYVYHFRILELEKAILWRWSFTMGGHFKGDPIIYAIPILGQVLSVLLPIILEALRKFSNSKNKVSISIFLLMIIISTILLSGNRNAVIMMIMSFSIWFIYVGVVCRYFKNYLKSTISVIVLVCMLFSVLLINNSSRISSLLNIESTELRHIDSLSSHRLPLWEVAYKMTKDHWVNGIGPRGFRYGYNIYKPDKGKYAVEYEHGSTHPHFALLEILLETGIIGLFSLFFLFWIIFKSILKVNHDNQLILVPWFIALITAIVPNIGKAFYSSYWLTLILFLLIGCASIINFDTKTQH